MFTINPYAALYSPSPPPPAIYDRDQLLKIGKKVAEVAEIPIPEIRIGPESPNWRARALSEPAKPREWQSKDSRSLSEADAKVKKKFS